jgi:hypothetical protein
MAVATTTRFKKETKLTGTIALVMRARSGFVELIGPLHKIAVTLYFSFVIYYSFLIFTSEHFQKFHKPSFPDDNL